MIGFLILVLVFLCIQSKKSWTKGKPKRKVSLLLYALGRFEFLVKWEGWEENQATWEPEANLKYIKELIDKFNEDH